MSSVRHSCSLEALLDQLNLSVILITHEMDVVRGAADRVAVPRHGRIVEQGRVRELIADPASATGSQLLPLTALPSDDPALLQVEIRYAADRAVPADWISRISEALAVRVAVLGGSIKAADNGANGRLRIAIKARSGPSPPPSRRLAPGAVRPEHRRPARARWQRFLNDPQIQKLEKVFADPRIADYLKTRSTTPSCRPSQALDGRATLLVYPTVSMIRFKSTSRRSGG